MIVSDRSLIGNSDKGKYPNMKCLYSTIPRSIRRHMQRVAMYAQVLFIEAKKQGVWDASLPEDILEYSEEIFKLHDIGRHYIPIEIYNKIEKLTKEEIEEIKKHTVYSLKAEESVFFEFLPERMMPYFREVALMHHEHFDGNGYPYQKAGEEIPFMARVCAIADAYDGMVSFKTYRKSMTNEQAIEVLKRKSGKQFQPELVECFIRCKKEIERIDLMENGK